METKANCSSGDSFLHYSYGVFTGHGPRWAQSLESLGHLRERWRQEGWQHLATDSLGLTAIRLPGGARTKKSNWAAFFLCIGWLLAEHQEWSFLSSQGEQLLSQHWALSLDSRKLICCLS